jgi:NCS1 family nucleobase:cation symporter-1
MEHEEASLVRITKVERHSIDYIPEHERHGKAWHQAPFWFAGNFIFPTILTGFIGISLGLSLAWSLVAIFVGLIVGTTFVALHANQGPRLGLPQMLQSRAQFGSKGAVVPLLVAVCIYIGFCVFNIIAAAGALDLLSSPASWVWIFICFAIAFVAAVAGHDILHFIQRWVTYILILVMVPVTVYALVHYHVPPHATTAFIGSAFTAQVLAAASFQLSYAVFVSDYTRYLPTNVSAPKLIAWTYGGMAVSSAWLMGLAAFFGATLPAADMTNAVSGVQQVGNSLFSGFGTFVVVISVPALISITAVELYGTMLSGTAGVDAFKKVVATRRLRIIGILIATVASFVLTVALPSNYLGSFGGFLTLLIDFLGPWTAINLTDFYLIRHGKYNSAEIVSGEGRYGGWYLPGVVAYVVAIAVEVPFWSLPFFEGSVARSLSGVDISFIVGLVVGGAVYFVLDRVASRKHSTRVVANDVSVRDVSS